MPRLFRVAGLALAIALCSGCICARAPYHGRIPSRNLARAPVPPASTPPPEYVIVAR